ncbi:putative repeat protein (TIGR01451 family) [Streptosporangium becharense]|uniref:Putative repeat protein (TIGR01451 family) n=1 Tax=Streptosporangium becharense TaxID=1816182 RepID=A0A7W9IEZ8_9ACTN|nr:CARDB domain-containing protein [Streptosporangium becharense]MBB2909606.1 putative repeat protein (TIGR01451 family) [Streptosporangium becharense]MBB5819438.1 putative repeat protein (TIGR01451 family) [Streptosporangium becharense]
MMRHIRRMCYPVAALAVLAGPLAVGGATHAHAAQAGPAPAVPAGPDTGRAGPPTEAAPGGTVLRAGPDPASCPARVALVNGGFERPAASNAVNFFPDASRNAADSVPGWLTTARDRTLEIWTGPANPTNTAPAEGRQFAELNANEVSTLYQDHATTPGAKLYWRLSHRGRQGTDTMALDIGAPGSPVPQRVMSDGTGAWGTHTGVYTVPAGQTTTRFAFRSVSAAGGVGSVGNFLDDVFFGTAPCVVVTKAAIPEGPVDVGDVITYRLTARNEGGGVAENVRLTDAVPAGTSYVPGSLRVVDGPNSGVKTDGPGDDQAAFDAATGKVFFLLGVGATGSAAGRLPNTADLPGGTTVEFRVKVGPAAAGKQVVNQGSVTYENRLGATPEPLTSTSGEASTRVNPAVDLSVVKSADPTTATIGQNVTYRLAVRNAGPSDATGVTVKDILPRGVAFVSATASAGDYVAATGTWRVGELAAGGTALLTIHVKATVAGERTNIVTVRGDEKDLDPANDIDAVRICVRPAASCENCCSARCVDCGTRAG